MHCNLFRSFGAGVFLLSSLAAAGPVRSLETRQSCGDHGPTNRGCWGDYNIDSDYEKLVPPNGKLRTVRLPSIAHHGASH